jgi:hypothetical protein
MITSFFCNGLLVFNKYRSYNNYKNKNFIRLFSRNYITINNDNEENKNNESNNYLLNNLSNNITDNETETYNSFINFAKINDIKINIQKSLYEGCDMTYNISNNNDTYIIEKIGENFYKKKILDNLLDYKICEEYKIKYIEEYNDIFNDNKYTYNIKSGGLYNDWNFTL